MKKYKYESPEFDFLQIKIGSVIMNSDPADYEEHGKDPEDDPWGD